MALKDFERYTCIGSDDSDKKAQMTTFNKSMMRKMDKLCKSHPKEFKQVSEQILDGVLEGKEYEFPKNLITIRTPTKRTMTEDQKQKAAERMNKMHEKNKEKNNKTK